MPDAAAIAAALIACGITIAIPRFPSDAVDVAIYVLVADYDPQEKTNG